MSRSNAITVGHGVSLKKIKDKVQVIAERYKPEKIVLFGSYASGNTTTDSDVDLLVIIKTDQPTWDLCIDISLMVKHSFPMDIIVRTPLETARRIEAGDFFMKEILERGKVLYERIG